MKTYFLSLAILLLNSAPNTSFAQTKREESEKRQWSIGMNALNWAGIFAGPELRLKMQKSKNTFQTLGVRFSFYEPYLSPYNPNALSPVHIKMRYGGDLSIGIGYNKGENHKQYHLFQIQHGRYNFTANQRYCAQSTYINSEFNLGICVCEIALPNQYQIETTRYGFSYEYGAVIYERGAFKLSGALNLGLIYNVSKVEGYLSNAICQSISVNEEYRSHKFEFDAINLVFLRQGLGGIDPSSSNRILVPHLRPLVFITYQL